MPLPGSSAAFILSFVVQLPIEQLKFSPLHLQRVYSENLVMVVSLGRPIRRHAERASRLVYAHLEPRYFFARPMRRECGNFRVGHRLAATIQACIPRMTCNFAASMPLLR